MNIFDSVSNSINESTTYTLLHAGVDTDGWYKYFLKRSDGKEITVNPRRYRELVRKGRIAGGKKEQDRNPGVRWKSDADIAKEQEELKRRRK
jgi:hypothetical protein